MSNETSLGPKTKIRDLDVIEAPGRAGIIVFTTDVETGIVTVEDLLKLSRASDSETDPEETGLDAANVSLALAKLAAPSFIFGSRTSPIAALQNAAEITCDLLDGRRLFFTHNMAGDEMLLAPEGAPLGATFYLLVDPGAHTLSFATGYQGPGDQLPDIADETMFAIVVAGASRFLVHVVGSNYGNGA
jgi:hypothetical protein